MDNGAACACLRVVYNPEDVEIENPVTHKMVTGKRDRWLCADCGAEFNRVLWHKAVVAQQQAELEPLRALRDELVVTADLYLVYRDAGEEPDAIRALKSGAFNAFAARAKALQEQS